MIFMGMKEWKKALHILSIVISLPSINVVSMIMVEAYKKWILLSLLETGRPLPLPNMTPPHMANLYRSLARPYEAIADIFKKGNSDRLKAEVDVGRSIWQMDNNTGLVEQVLAACRQHSILKMGNTFAALTMTDLSHRTMLNDVNFKEDELLASSLIISRKLNATLLNRKDAFGSTMLRFSTYVPSTDFHKETSIQQPLLIERQRLMVLCANVNESDKRLQLTKEHINTLRKGLKRNDNGPRDGSTLSKGASPEFDFEEDMMADLQ
jgi:COP9 signalosome complex subunit 3